MSLIIDPTLRDVSDIRRAIISYVAAQPDEVRWNDFYAAGAGQIIIDLIAGFGGFDAYNADMVLRELGQSTAVLGSSIRQHAFNKGIIEGPSDTLELELQYQVAPGQHVVIAEGSMMGRMGDYEIYSLENIDTLTDFTVRAAVGFLEEITQTFGSQALSTISLDLEREFVANRFERLVIDGVEIALRNDPADLTQLGSNFVLRQLTPYLAQLYIGNGSLGWYDPNAVSLTYHYLNYGREIETIMALAPATLLTGASLVRYTVVKRPTFGLDKQQLKALISFYPLDGRIAQDRDYEGVILSRFGGVVSDVYSWNADPDQQVKLLAKSGFDSAIHLPEIIELVDSKRMLNINVDYSVVAAVDGASLTVQLVVPESDYQSYMAQASAVSAYLASKTLKFVRSADVLAGRNVIRAHDVAVDLTDRFNLRFYPKADSSVTLAVGGFLGTLLAQVEQG